MLHIPHKHRFRLQLLGQILYQVCSIIGTVFSLLLFFKNTLTHVPIHLHPAEIHTAHGLRPCCVYNPSDIIQESFLFFSIPHSCLISLFIKQFPTTVFVASVPMDNIGITQQSNVLSYHPV